MLKKLIWIISFYSVLVLSACGQSPQVYAPSQIEAPHVEIYTTFEEEGVNEDYCNLIEYDENEIEDELDTDYLYIEDDEYLNELTCCYESDESERAKLLGLERAITTRIIDGDTIDVTISDVEERVRFIGIDTPERGEPGFSEATEFVRNAIEAVDNIVWLQASGNERCPYNRLRRYIWLGVPYSLECKYERARLLLNDILVYYGYAVIWIPGGNNSSTNQNYTPNAPSTTAYESEMIVYWTPAGCCWHRTRECQGLNNANPANIRSGTIAESGKDRECSFSAAGN